MCLSNFRFRFTHRDVESYAAPPGPNIVESRAPQAFYHICQPLLLYTPARSLYNIDVHMTFYHYLY